MPDSPPSPVKVILTGWLYQPSLSAGRSGLPATAVGAVLSMLIGRLPAVSPLPALSVERYCRVCFASLVTATGAEYVTPPALSRLYSVFATPEPPSLSLAVSVTVTLSLYQPLALAARSGVAVVVGGAVSL